MNDAPISEEEVGAFYSISIIDRKMAKAWMADLLTLYCLLLDKIRSSVWFLEEE